MKQLLKRIIPKNILNAILPAYHFALVFTGTLLYRFPSRHLTVIGVTGTKGKTSTTELLNGILESAGKKTAVLGTLRFKVGEKSGRNLRKMTMPGRFFVQKFLRDAVDAGCSHAIIEMTSEGAKQFRQRFVAMDALIFTNLAPEHIESHGSYEKYRDAKLAIGWTLARSSKPHRFMVANADDPVSALFLKLPHITPVPFRKIDAGATVQDINCTTMTWRGAAITAQLSGVFATYNMLAAATCAEALGIALPAIKQGLEKTINIPGRMEHINVGQSFPVIVDYAHTPDSLEQVYKSFPDHNKICVLGNTGGGRDRWKRPVMGSIADTYCSHIILTNEDPYDEDPVSILEEMEAGMKTNKPEIVIDRRMAITRALLLGAHTPNAAVLITGKGTDPYIMGPNGSKTPWDDRDIVREELSRITLKTS